MDITATLHALGVTLQEGAGPTLAVHSPIDGSPMASLRCHTRAEVDASMARAVEAFLVWRDVPAPQRGALVRLFGEALRALKEPFARLVTLESGKILEEARGEVQEMIDMCDFAAGLSRQLYGLTIASERPDHSMQETWLPLGPIGIITAAPVVQKSVELSGARKIRVEAAKPVQTPGKPTCAAKPVPPITAQHLRP